MVVRAPSKGISALKVIWNPLLAISTSLHGGLSLLESYFSDWDFGPSGASCPRKTNAVGGHNSHKSQNQRLEGTSRGDLHPSCSRTAAQESVLFNLTISMDTPQPLQATYSSFWQLSQLKKKSVMTCSSEFF